jgi:hypothetical protein
VGVVVLGRCRFCGSVNLQFVYDARQCPLFRNDIRNLEGDLYVDVIGYSERELGSNYFEVEILDNGLNHEIQLGGDGAWGIACELSYGNTIVSKVQELGRSVLL